MKASTGLRYDFDPYGAAQTKVADWERRIEVSNMRLQAREAKTASRDAGKSAQRLSLWVRLARLARVTHGTAPRLGEAH